MGSPLPSPTPSLGSPRAAGATPGRFSTPSLDLPRFHLPASSTQRSIERHREEALQVSLMLRLSIITYGTYIYIVAPHTWH